jgi:hypothetical protein
VHDELPLMISTMGMTGTGEKKCIPITFSGRFVDAAIFVMEMELTTKIRAPFNNQQLS